MVRFKIFPIISPEGKKESEHLGLYYTRAVRDVMNKTRGRLADRRKANLSFPEGVSEDRRHLEPMQPIPGRGYHLGRNFDPVA